MNPIMRVYAYRRASDHSKLIHDAWTVAGVLGLLILAAVTS